MWVYSGILIAFYTVFLFHFRFHSFPPAWAALARADTSPGADPRIISPASWVRWAGGGRELFVLCSAAASLPSAEAGCLTIGRRGQSNNFWANQSCSPGFCSQTVGAPCADAPCRCFSPFQAQKSAILSSWAVETTRSQSAVSRTSCAAQFL